MQTAHAASAVPAFSDPTPVSTKTAPAVLLYDLLPALNNPVRRQGGYRPAGHTGELLLNAEQEADRIIASARDTADEITASAREDADTLRSEAHSHGYAEGASEARAQVEAALTEQFNEQAATLRESVNWVVASILQERERMWHDAEHEITTLAMEIARKVIKVEVDRSDDVIQAVITDALRRVSDRANVRILVSPGELQQIRSRREDLLQALDGIKNLVIDGDRRIASGGCMIETNAGAVDAKIDTQLEQISQALSS